MPATVRQICSPGAGTAGTAVTTCTAVARGGTTTTPARTTVAAVHPRDGRIPAVTAGAARAAVSVAAAGARCAAEAAASAAAGVAAVAAGRAIGALRRPVGAVSTRAAGSAVTAVTADTIRAFG